MATRRPSPASRCTYSLGWLTEREGYQEVSESGIGFRSRGGNLDRAELAMIQRPYTLRLANVLALREMSSSVEMNT